MNRMLASIASSIAAILLPVAVLAFGKNDSRNAEECRAQVNANFDAVIADMRKHGNYVGIPHVEMDGRAVYLQECDQMESTAQQRHMTKAYQRLSSAIETLKTGGTISDEAHQELNADHEAIQKYKRVPYRDACLQMFADYQRYVSAQPTSQSTKNAATKIYRCTRASGQVEFTKLPCDTGVAQSELNVDTHGAGTFPSWQRCNDLAKQIDVAKTAHDNATAALLPSQSTDGTTSAPANWRELNAQRERSLAAWQFVQSRARAEGCISK